MVIARDVDGAPSVLLRKACRLLRASTGQSAQAALLSCFLNQPRTWMSFSRVGISPRDSVARRANGEIWIYWISWAGGNFVGEMPIRDPSSVLGSMMLAAQTARYNLIRRTSLHVCMSIHPEGKSCGLVRSRRECLFSMTLIQGRGVRLRLQHRGRRHRGRRRPRRRATRRGHRVRGSAAGGRVGPCTRGIFPAYITSTTGDLQGIDLRFLCRSTMRPK